MENNEDVKKCNTCLESKSIQHCFSMQKSKNGKSYPRFECNDCKNKRERERKLQNKEHNKTVSKIYTEKNKEKRKEYAEEYRLNNKEKIKSYYQNNIEYYQEKNAKYKVENAEKIKEMRRVYHASDEFKEKKRIKDKERRQVDPEYRLKSYIRGRINMVTKGVKSGNTHHLIGCNFEQLKKWLKYQLKDDMTFDNYGKVWHIDHVIPIAFFDIKHKNEQELAFNWSNLQPLKAEENLVKNNKIISSYIISHMDKLNTFTNSYEGYQTNTQTCWWQRVKLWYGNNPKDEENFESFLKLAIRNEAPKGSENLPTGNAQRLNGSGSV